MQSIILSRRDFREFDQVISVYTKEKGKLELLARGVKKINSKNAAHLEPFSFVDISIAAGKELDILTTVQPIEYFVQIRKDVKKSLLTSFLVSLIDKVTQVGEKDDSLFDSLLSWLIFVENCKKVATVLVDGYIVTLLHCFGFMPGLDECVVCEKVEDFFGFYFAGGGVICKNCAIEKKKINEQVAIWDVEMKKNFELLATGNWQLILNIKFDHGEYERLHKLIYEFFVYHQEKKIGDWNRTGIRFKV